jgi:hypothetical protein
MIKAFLPQNRIFFPTETGIMSSLEHLQTKVWEFWDETMSFEGREGWALLPQGFRISHPRIEN